MAPGRADQDRDPAGFFVRQFRLRVPGADSLHLVRTDTGREAARD